jgi:hypothetical protein
VGGVKCLLSLAFLPGWCISILLERVCHQVPGPIEDEATISVKVFGVKSDLSSFLYHAINISCGLIQDGGATELTRLIAREDFINVSHRESFRSCISNLKTVLQVYYTT